MRKRFKTVDVICPLTGQHKEVSARFAARVTGRSLRTAQRWANGSRIDNAAHQALVMRVFGVLPGDAWRDFRLCGDRLENVATGETWTPQQLAGVWISLQQLREYRRRAGLVPPSTLRLAR